jgi:hypothetical protein
MALSAIFKNIETVARVLFFFAPQLEILLNPLLNQKPQSLIT